MMSQDKGQDPMFLPLQFKKLGAMSHPVYFQCEVPSNWITLGRHMKKNVQDPRWQLILNGKVIVPIGMGVTPLWKGEEMYAMACFLLPEFFADDASEKIVDVSAFEVPSNVDKLAGSSFLQVVMQFIHEQR